MGTIQRLFSLFLGLLLLISLSACSGGTTGTPGASKASVTVSFVKANKVAVKAATLQELGIARLTLDVIPANANSYKPAQIDLMAVYNGGSTNTTVNSLTDNETYLFRVMAYDAKGGYLYGGQSTAVIQTSTTVGVTCAQFGGFGAVAGVWNGVADNGGTVSGTVGTDGTSTAVDSLGYAISGFFVPSATAGTYDYLAFSTKTGMTAGSSIILVGSTTGSNIAGTYKVVPSNISGTWTSTKAGGTGSLTWSAYVEGLNGFNQTISSANAFQGGYAYIAPSLVNNTYYWSEFLGTSSAPLNGDNMMVEAYLRNNQADGGLSCYDTSIMLYDSDPYGAPFAAFWMMQPSCASYASLEVRPVNGTGVGQSNLSELAVDLAAWHKVAIKTKGNKMQVYYDDKMIKEVSYTGSLGMLKTIRIHTKGSGRVDWVKVYENEVLKYTEDFNASGPTTYTVTPSAGTGGTISPATVQNVSSGATTSFTITPSSGYSIASVTGCGGTLSGNTYTTGAITGNCAVTTIFTPITTPWIQTGGPSGVGATTAVAIDPANSQTIYAATESGGVFKSTNGGTNWAAVNTGLTNLKTWRALAIDPANSQVIYVGTQGQGAEAFKSINGGGSWIALNLGLSVSTLAIDPTNSQVIYAGTNGGGVFKTTNGGTSWTGVNNGLTAIVITAIAIAPTNSQLLYAGTSGNGVFKSTNGGNSWIAVNTGIGNFVYIDSLAIDPFNSQTVYIGTGSYVFKSTDGGSNWSVIKNTGAFAIAIDPTNSQVIYTSSSKSTDGGTAWIDFTSFPGASSLAIDPANSKVIYAGTNGSVVFKTTTGGQ